MKERLAWTITSMARLKIRDAFNALFMGYCPIHVDDKGQILYRAMTGIRSWRMPPGDYLEFGVYRGRSFLHAYQAAKELQLDYMNFYAFDSFKGLPEVTGADKSYDHFRFGQYACSEDEFRRILQKAGVNLSRITLVPGFYNESLTAELKQKLPIKRAAIVWIDCDIYESTVPVLEFITDYITSGTILIFDDWFIFGANPKAGELKATNEWLERYPGIKLESYHLFGISGKSFIVQRYDKG